MITGDYQLMFEDAFTGDLITLGGDEEYCSVRFEGLGSAELRTAERELAAEDGFAFGPEYLGKRNWTITGSVKAGTSTSTGLPQDAWNGISKLIRAWDRNRARLSSRECVPLYFKRPGRETVVVYGRPERIDPETAQSYVGFITYSAVFRQSDPVFYSAALNSMTVNTTTPYVGGLLYGSTGTGLMLPFSTSAVTRTGAFMTNAGDTSTPVEMFIQGPVTNPSVALLDASGEEVWSIKLKTSVESDQYVTIDSRLWKRSVLRNDGASLAGYLRGARLADLRVPPGDFEIVYESQNTNGSSTCSIQFRNAWASV